jgi:phosphoglycolate phosphatase
MSIGAVLFDLDGTLVDSAPDLAAAANALLAERGLSALQTAEIVGMIGDGVGKLVERVFAARGVANEPIDDAVARFLVLYQQDAVTLTRPYPGVREGLSGLHAAGWQLGLCTNKPEKPTRLILDRLGLAGLFGTVITGDSLSARKPDPAPLRLALVQLDIAPARAAMVGDHRNDVLAAEAAGVRAIFARYGYGRTTLGTLLPAASIDHFAELPWALRSLGRGMSDSS